MWKNWHGWQTAGEQFRILSNWWRSEEFDGLYGEEYVPHLGLGELAQTDILCQPDPGLLPGFTSLTNGDITAKRKMIKEVSDLSLWVKLSLSC
jgi:hypothetical protein